MVGFVTRFPGVDGTVIIGSLPEMVVVAVEARLSIGAMVMVFEVVELSRASFLTREAWRSRARLGTRNFEDTLKESEEKSKKAGNERLSALVSFLFEP